MSKEKDTPNRGKNKKIRNSIILIFSVIFLFTGIFCVYADQMLSKINFIPDETASGSTASRLQAGSLFNSGAESGAASARSGILGGLYHDDAITNILILGVDDYQANDPGRSDTMMMVSVDTRHKKLKLTSFMRDMYVAIPGHSSNKLNAAYHFAGGGAGGARMTVQTIEANFGTDIDRYVIISNSAFDQIVDKLGGVTMTLTAAEAKLVNRYSGDPRYNLKEGTFNLSGKQAHYYSRIRAIGDDFERTQRQRKVFASLADKFKTANIATIYSALSDTLHLVTTNMTKNEILSMAGNSLTYLNYPISQNRIPADGEYYTDNLAVGNVLVPDLDKARKRVADFVFESDLPAPAKEYQQ